MDEDELQVLRNITREYMREMANKHHCEYEDTKSIVCVKEALKVLDKHKFKADRPL